MNQTKREYFLVVMGIVLIFFSFDALQQFTVLIVENYNVGIWTLMLMYLVFIISLLFTPLLERTYSIRNFLIISIIFYSFYPLSILFGIPVIGGIIRAIGGALFWAFYPTIINILAIRLNKRVEILSGKINGFRLLGSFLGCIILGILLTFLDKNIVISLYFIVSITSIFLILNTDIKNIEQNVKLINRVSLSVLKEKNIANISVLWLLEGFLFGSMISYFPNLVFDFVKESFIKYLIIGIIFSLLYLFIAISSFYGGFEAKRWIYSPIYLASILGLVISLIMIINLSMIFSNSLITFLIILAFSLVIGLLESESTSGLIIYLSEKYGKNRTVLSSTFFVVRQVGVLMGIILTNYLGLGISTVFLLLLFINIIIQVSKTRNK